ncbi:hypothetical protein [Sphingobacterium multivorum]|uniref:hypothetical protein n=1 Tax=Sphingobacterium multivorum TaxID=28454 RepID=UPI0028AFA5A1|nr:hypothetical protein [Sphingobacterium multivorum]
MRKKFINLTAFLALILLAVWGCVKDAKIDPIQENGDIEKVAAWYQRQLIPTNVKGAFANVNSPNWSDTKVEKLGDSTFFTTLLLRDSIITRELQVTLHDGAYEGVVRQYQFKSTDSIFAGTFTVNGRLIDLGVYNKEGRYKLLGVAGNRNIVLMGIEDIDGGTLPEVNVPPPPSNPGFPPSWPSYPPPPPPSYPPTYPPGGSGGGGGGSGTTVTRGGYIITNNLNNPCLKGMVDKIVDKDIVFKANESLKSIFGANAKFNVIFYESTELKSDVNGNAKPNRIVYDSQGNLSEMDVDIKLNLNNLPGSSQEYIAMIVVHEAVHAYLDYKGYSYNTNQHDIMLRDYVDVIANYLVNNFNTPVNDAYSVAFGGLYQAFQNSVNNQTWSSIESKLGNKLPSLNDRSRILADYETGHKGAKCQ